MPISDKLIDQLLEGHNSPEAILGEEGLLKQLTKRVAERALQAEMDQHLGYDKHDRKSHNMATPETAAHSQPMSTS